jgi:hypothetical protein
MLSARMTAVKEKKKKDKNRKKRREITNMVND